MAGFYAVTSTSEKKRNHTLDCVTHRKCRTNNQPMDSSFEESQIMLVRWGTTAACFLHNWITHPLLPPTSTNTTTSPDWFCLNVKHSIKHRVMTYFQNQTSLKNKEICQADQNKERKKKHQRWLAKFRLANSLVASTKSGKKNIK